MVELGAIIIVAILLPTTMVWLLDRQMNHYQVRTLTEQAHGISRGISVRNGQRVVHLDPDLAQTYATAYDGRAYVVADSAGRSVAQSAFARLVPWRQAPRLGRLQAFRVGAIVGVSEPVGTGNARSWVIVTQDETGRGAIVDDVVRAFVTLYGPILLLILLLLPLLNSLLIRRLVIEVRSVSAQAGTIGPKTLDVRLEEAGLPLEVAPLAKATNALLVRLQQSFQQQSEFVANVAHELRTPLTTLKFELEAVDDATVRNNLRRTADRLGHVIAQLQALAALEVTPRSFISFDAVALAREVIGELAPQILAKGDDIELDAPDHPVLVRADRTLIALALSNLVSNATRHTPAGTAIRVRLTDRGVLQVTDNGPGIACSDPERAKIRYWRADDRRSDSAGLGLSIVTRIIKVHDGDLGVESAIGGGASFTLMLPLAAPQ